MVDTEKGRKLTERAISSLIDFRGAERAEDGGPLQLPRSLRPPSSDNLDFGAVGARGLGKGAAEGAVHDVGSEQATEYAGREWYPVAPQTGPRRRSRVAILLLLIWIATVLALVNELYGRPLLRSGLLKVRTYGTRIADYVGSRSETSDDAGREEGGLKLTGIAYNRDRPSAVIGTAIVHEGDIISGATVVKISADGVTFEADGRTWMQKVN